MQHKLRRLSWPEGCEVWIAWDTSYMAFPTTHEGGGHKEWLIVCMRNDPKQSLQAGDVLDVGYTDLRDAKNKLEELIEGNRE